jgi:hypothetical protein
VKHKQPRKDGRFSFAVITNDDLSTTYRLSRRDFRNKLYFVWRTFAFDEGDKVRAQWLWKARRELLDRVDAIELGALGYVA